MDAQYDGGGWTLLLTQTDADSNFPGTVNPFLQTEGYPSRTKVYSVNRANTFTPKLGDEFMIVRETSKDFVRMKILNWPYGAAWDGVNSGSHGDIADGLVYDSSGNELDGITHFTCCNKVGGCASTGADACGFSNYEQYTLNSNPWKSYGYSWTAASTSTGARMAWGVSDQYISDPALTYWFREATTREFPRAALAEPAPGTRSRHCCRRCSAFRFFARCARRCFRFNFFRERFNCWLSRPH